MKPGRNSDRDRKKDEITAEDSNFEQLRPIYNAVNQKIEDEDRAVINEQTHVGTSRGGDVKKDFKKAVRRAPNDSLDNYKIENDGNGYPIIIEEA
ncbi:MAG: hypothetical protein ABEJ87_05055 [Candidatus Nanohalobium sp.]